MDAICVTQRAGRVGSGASNPGTPGFRAKITARIGRILRAAFRLTERAFWHLICFLSRWCLTDRLDKPVAMLPLWLEADQDRERILP